MGTEWDNVREVLEITTWHLILSQEERLTEKDGDKDKDGYPARLLSLRFYRQEH